METSVLLGLQVICLLGAAKLLAVKLNLVTSSVIVGATALVATLLPLLLVLPSTLLIYTGLIKNFDGHCNMVKVLFLVIISFLVQEALFVKVIKPVVFGPMML